MCHQLCTTEKSNRYRRTLVYPTNPLKALRMSRRHKENDIDNIKPQQAESHEDGSPRVKRCTVSCASFINKLIKVDKSYVDHVMEAVVTAFTRKEYLIDDEWVKIPRRYFDHSLFSIEHELGHIAMTPYPSEEKPKRGHPLLKRFISKFEDNIVVNWFKTTLKALKETCRELYHGLTQFAVCFQNGIHEAFAPDEDPYGKMSHYWRMLEPEINGFPSRETLGRNYRWFRDWRETVTYEDSKAKKERHKHRIWERLIHWIKEFLLKLEPQYAAQPLYGVGI
jgi:hypothetical protein